MVFVSLLSPDGMNSKGIARKDVFVIKCYNLIEDSVIR